jgi:hypothetical protein
MTAAFGVRAFGTALVVTPDSTDFGGKRLEWIFSGRCRVKGRMAMMSKPLYDDVKSKYSQFLKNDLLKSSARREVLDLIEIARVYLAAVEEEYSDEADQIKLRDVRVEFRNATKVILNQSPWLDTEAQQALRGFMIELPEFLIGKYRFTVDYFSNNIGVWKQTLARFAHKADLNFLEIGSFEGRSACWLLENILTSDSSKLTCIDTFDFAGQGVTLLQDEGSESMSIEERFDYNIKLAGRSNNVRKIVGYSRDALRNLPLSSFDFIYIDGAHMANNVLEDAVLSWPLLRNGGLLTFDDYGWEGHPNLLFRPKVAVDAFLAIYKLHYRLVHKDYQVTIEKA